MKTKVEHPFGIAPYDPTKWDAAGVIGRICPEDGAVNGRLRADWDDICERTAYWLTVWMEEEPRRMKPDHSHRDREMMRQRGLVKAIEYRSWLLSVTEPDGDKCVLKPLKKKTTISEELSEDKNDG